MTQFMYCDEQTSKVVGPFDSRTQAQSYISNIYSGYTVTFVNQNHWLSFSGERSEESRMHYIYGCIYEVDFVLCTNIINYN